MTLLRGQTRSACRKRLEATQIDYRTLTNGGKDGAIDMNSTPAGPSARARSALATCAVLLLSLPAFALAQAQDIHVVGVPLVTGAPIQFHRLSWPSTPVVVQRMVQDDHGFLWLSAADGVRRYDGYGLMRVAEPARC
jgi:hypothetical protein